MSCDGGKNYYWYLGKIFTNNKINLANYSKLYISSNIVGNPSAGVGNAVYSSSEKQKADNGVIIQTNEKYLKENMDFSYYKIGKYLEIIDIPDNWNGYIGILSAHSTSNTWYFDYQNSYMRNYTDTTRYIDLYNIVALKEDSWQTWARLAGINIENEENNSLEKILNNTSTLEKIFNNKKANKYLLKCTGTLMVEILKNDNSYNNIPSTLQEKMKENESWNHFLKVCERN